MNLRGMISRSMLKASRLEVQRPFQGAITRHFSLQVPTFESRYKILKNLPLSSLDSKVVADLDKRDHQWQLVSTLARWLDADFPTLTLENAFGRMEDYVTEYRAARGKAEKRATRLAQEAPLLHRYGKLFTDLPLRRAFSELSSLCLFVDVGAESQEQCSNAPLSGAYDKRTKISHRVHVPPSEDEIRYICQSAQCMASARKLKLCTFDGDGTLCELLVVAKLERTKSFSSHFDTTTTDEDRTFLPHDSPLVDPLLQLMYVPSFPRYEEV